MGADTTRRVRPGPRTLEAVQSLGILSEQETDSLRIQDSVLAVSDSLQQVLDSLKFVRADSARADSLADSLSVLQGHGLKLFGLETFRRTSTGSSRCSQARWTRIIAWARATCWY